jgi:hypothetical protein
MCRGRREGRKGDGVSAWSAMCSDPKGACGPGSAGGSSMQCPCGVRARHLCRERGYTRVCAWVCMKAHGGVRVRVCGSARISARARLCAYVRAQGLWACGHVHEAVRMRECANAGMWGGAGGHTLGVLLMQSTPPVLLLTPHRRWRKGNGLPQPPSAPAHKTIHTVAASAERGGRGRARGGG